MLLAFGEKHIFAEKDSKCWQCLKRVSKEAPKRLQRGSKEVPPSTTMHFRCDISICWRLFCKNIVIDIAVILLAISGVRLNNFHYLKHEKSKFENLRALRPLFWKILVNNGRVLELLRASVLFVRCWSTQLTNDAPSFTICLMSFYTVFILQTNRKTKWQPSNFVFTSITAFRAHDPRPRVQGPGLGSAGPRRVCNY